MASEEEAGGAGLEEAKILPLAEGDIEQVLAIERLSFSHPWSPYAFKQELRNKLSHLFCIKVPEDNTETLVAYLCLWLLKDEAHITNIAVHPRYRRRGLARRLLDFAEELAKRKGARDLTLEVRRSNLAAVEMYRQKGFQLSGIRRGYYYEEREDALVMTLKLDREPEVN